MIKGTIFISDCLPGDGESGIPITEEATLVKHRVGNILVRVVHAEVEPSIDVMSYSVSVLQDGSEIKESSWMAGDLEAGDSVEDVRMGIYCRITHSAKEVL